MNIKHILVFAAMPLCMFVNGQQIDIEGRFADAFTEVPLPQVKVSIEGFVSEVFSDSDGFFHLELEEVPSGEYILKIEKPGYLLKRIPIRSSPEKRSLAVVQLQADLSFEQNQNATISLSDAELLSEETEFDNISGILQSSRDVYFNAAAFDFGQTFYRPRGLGSEYGKVLINGIEMNQAFDGRPQWNSWGGLNDVQRNQIFNPGITENDFQFGGLGGTTNIIMRASKYQKGGRISASASNRSYTGRLMATYASGEEKNGWYYVFSASRRYAEEGYVEGTVYDANSIFVSVEKKINDNHSLNLSVVYTPNRRGKTAALTQEVFDLKGRKYNPYWGYQDNEIRNSRMREINQPFFQLNHFLKLGEKASLNTNLMYQFGEISNSRIDYLGASAVEFNNQVSYTASGENPDPTYYQKLPSYFLRFSDNPKYEVAWRAQKDIMEKGRLDWNALYSANAQAGENGMNSIYALAEDVNYDHRLGANSIFEYVINDHLKLNSSLSFYKLKTENFGRIKDLLGGKYFLDIDVFANNDGSGIPNQSDLNHFNRLVSEGEHYKYDYEVESVNSEFFSQLQYENRKWELFISGKIAQTSYQRFGNYQNGLYPETSLDWSKKLGLTDFGMKSGAVYKISDRQNIEFNAGYFTKTPGFKNAFVNPRQNNFTVPRFTSEKILSSDLSYRYRSSAFNTRITGFYTNIKDITEISYYYAEGLSGLERETTTAFVQEVLSGMDKRYYGLEFGAEYQLSSTIKIKSAAGLGEYFYSNNPNLMLTSAAFEGVLDYGKTYLKNYRLPGGPQTATQLGLEYRDPDFWWFGTSLNYFANAFIDINPLSRTANFQIDFDNQPLLDYDPEIASELLKQEKFDDYFIWNAIGGKSWRIKDKYLGLFASLNNILNTLYKSGGYEQARNSNYRELEEDTDREYPLFPAKYWYGQGTSFFINLNLRF
ncbi:TonB-dependent receptor [Christiangramia fulva]|uniref:TonB-dependent receptor n=1 Tax=Christiangramia fulva TaxID=2126553 RepID=A0A2R3Z409_9FLAO|nr:TonB-dependent receptor [Christiangramia fulva]AVR44968.1 TonB-dependent receptor [Christiangramia fulva]